MTITVSDGISLDGIGSNGEPSSVLSSVNAEVVGNGGDINITTEPLSITDGAQVTASNQGLGDAGDLNVAASSIQLDNKGKFTTETASGNGGDMTLQVQDLLLLRRNSEISTTAGIAGAGGNGGNITIDTPFIVAVPEENSNITANAFTGSGGRVQITTEGVFGLERSSVLTPLSDITAFSQQNSELNGVVQINTPDVDPSARLVALLAELVDASGLIAQTCPAGREGESEFIVTGRGGLPICPIDADLEPYPTGTVRSIPSTVQENYSTLVEPSTKASLGKCNLLRYLLT